jgi:hypothetical protein
MKERQIALNNPIILLIMVIREASPRTLNQLITLLIMVMKEVLPRPCSRC